MARYVSRPRAGTLDDPDHGPAATATEILVNDEWIETGLLDEQGEPLYRMRGRIRLGFTDE